MSGQRQKGNREYTGKPRSIHGRQNAHQVAMASKHESDMDFTTVHPMDTLLVQQLENILEGEKAIRARYSLLEPAANTPEVRMAFSSELSQLKDRADRLYRLMNAMDYYGSYEPKYATMTLSAT